MDDIFYVSDWCVDKQGCVICHGDESVKLEPKVMDLLVYMASNPDHVHSRDELLQNIWPGVVVSDEALTNAIIKLRKSFQDNAHQPQYIETLPKRGYRLIAPVSTNRLSAQNNPGQAAEQQSEKHFKPVFWLSGLVALTAIIWLVNIDQNSTLPNATETAGLALPEIPSIAVLPFINVGNEIEHNYFSDGITDDLITDLSSLSGLFVISRNSTFQYKGRGVDVRQVAGDLGVRYIVEGSVRRIDNQVRVNVQLIDGSSGGQLWAERYDGELKHVFELQDRITARIISALALRLSEQDASRLAEVETTSPEAYDEYLKGWELRWRFNREDFARAEVHFKNALQLDPDYARAHEALALIYWQAWKQKWHINSGSRLAGWVRAQKSLKASMVRPTVLSFSLRSQMYLHNRRYQQALEEAEKAVSLNPGSATGYLALADALAFSGQPLKAIENTKKAWRRDPNFPAPYLSIEGRAHFDREDYQQAISSLKRAISANPDDDESTVVLLATYGQLGLSEQASELLKQLNLKFNRKKLPEFTLDWPKNRWPYKNNEDRQRLIDGLRKALVPEW